MNSIRENIVAAIVTRFEAILKSTYETDLGKSVILWPTTALDEDELPAICIRDINEEFQNNVFSHHDCWLTITVNIVSDDPDIVRKGIADISKAIGTDPTWGDLAILTEPSLNEMMVKEDEETFGGAKIIFRIYYRTSFWNPYSA